MAYGTESIPKCDVIVGPGNKFVAEAKRTVYGTVGIDMVAVPTEVLIIADETSNPEWVAADMLAQAEHDVDAQPILVTNSETLANKVSLEIEKQLSIIKTSQTASASVEKNGIIILCDTLEQMCEVANKKAPEHLELAMDECKERTYLEQNCINYGSMFIGHESAEVLGDYAAGLNHTLPTSGTARFTGGLSVRMFLKTCTTLRTKTTASGLQEGVKKSLTAAQILGHAEGLEGHANAATIRLQ
jgi:histidinol dehydrogenase